MAAVVSMLCTSTYAGELARTDAERERFMREADIVASKRLGEGVTGSLKVKLSDGTAEHSAHVQSVDKHIAEWRGPRGQRVLNFRDSWQFNVAAYRIDRLLDLGVVPVAVERRVDDRRSAVSWWVDGVQFTEGKRAKKRVIPPDAVAWDQQMRVQQVFDALIANADRNLGNILIDRDWKVWLIDHTRSFRLNKTPDELNRLVRCDRELLGRLRALDRASLEAATGDYLSGTAIDALLARRDAIVERFEQLIGSSGEAAVLFERPTAGSLQRAAFELPAQLRLQ